MKADEEDKQDRLPSVSGPSLGQANLSAPPEVEGYEILRVLGEGGMGIVYLSRQKHAVQRQVALKIVKPGMYSKQVVARFEGERQALAILDHPNIAQVYDAGTTKDGHPYFSMEYVSGPPITEYCDKNTLRIEERLRLFIQICEGVQYAHQKGIIHRDIKPSNVLVYKECDKPLPKIIDFGVAKALTAPLTEKTFFTEQGQLLGTPEYMSPEQAEMTINNIDARTDVYSLGVLLYMLLTGALPFDRKALELAGFAEILRTIREQDPPMPSMCLSSLGEKANQVAKLRKSSPNLLTKRVHGDLDWIVMKSLEKDRIQRYSTVAELAVDIRRHLNSEPVQAGPPTVPYKLHKFIKRHRVGVIACGLVIMAIVIGLIIGTYGLIKAHSARDRAVEVEGGAVIKALTSAYHRRSISTGQGDSRYARAIKDYYSVLYIKPNYVLVLDDLAWLLATCPRAELRDGAEAVKLAMRACEITDWKDYHCINTLAAANAEAGIFDAATKYQEQAIEILRDSKQPLLQASCEWRLKQYESEKPYHKGLVGWWKFDGDTTDASGYEYHGTEVGNPTYVAGISGEAIALRGDGDRVIVPGIALSVNGLDELTVSLWIKSNLIGTDKGFIAFKDPNNNNCAGMRYDAEGAHGGGRNLIKCGLTSDGGRYSMEGSSNFQTTEWQHLAMIWWTRGFLRLYINGREDTPMWIEPATSGLLTRCKKLFIGKGGKTMSNQSWAGLIDDVRIYSYALTEWEIRELYESTKSGGAEYYE